MGFETKMFCTNSWAVWFESSLWDLKPVDVAREGNDESVMFESSLWDLKRSYTGEVPKVAGKVWKLPMGFETPNSFAHSFYISAFESSLWDLKHDTCKSVISAVVLFESSLWDLKLSVCLRLDFILSGLKAPYGIWNLDNIVAETPKKSFESSLWDLKHERCTCCFI